MPVYASATYLAAVLPIVSLVLLTCMPPLTAAAHELADTSSMSTPRFPALFIFGDSIMDTGNNNAIPTVVRCRNPPYGIDFPQREPTGRCSNGRLPSDMMASTVGIKEFLPPYLSTTSADELLTGVTFASAASGYDPLTSQLTSVLSISKQLDLFREYKEKIAAIAGKERADSIVSKSLFVLCAGSNDVVVSYNLRQAQYDVPSYIDFLVGIASGAVQDLYHLGARKIGIVGLPPLGCAPLPRTLVDGLTTECSSFYNQICVQYNTQLSSELNRLQKQIQDSKIIFIDIYSPVLDLIQRPSLYGFKDVANGCCGTIPNETPIPFLCNRLSVCQDDSEYLFWDFIHPTEKAYNLTIKYVEEKYLPLF